MIMWLTHIWTRYLLVFITLTTLIKRGHLIRGHTSEFSAKFDVNDILLQGAKLSSDGRVKHIEI